MAVFMASLVPVTAFSQEELPWKEASASSQAYHKYRQKTTIPPYGLAKVKKLISGIVYLENDGDNGISGLSNKAYMALSLREKFTYHMIHAEVSSQNCDVSPPILDEDKKIFGNLPDAFDEAAWSERQENFLVSNRDSVLALIKASVSRTNRVGLNYKAAIVQVNGRALIPFLIETYKRDQKDYDILTVLMLLMKKGEYKPFMTSASFVKLYGSKSTYLSFIDHNKANEELIINRATAFYNGHK
ncbi:hypothetical protein [Pedobacter sp. FW305-3-2-15-E-R2A2]|jgi:hypothetical protein|uniref:hypothetical protein n=1 Tax=Pedobacter sp. FW305-3-2-15-E-R2A2 TaxID=3140251 RepID=UPI0031405A0A